jgi:hypothetical protein
MFIDWIVPFLELEPSPSHCVCLICVRYCDWNPTSNMSFLQENNFQCHWKQALLPFRLNVTSFPTVGNPQLKLTNNCIGAVEGWLIMINYYEMFLLESSEWLMFESWHNQSCPPTYSSVRGDRTPCVRKMVASSKPNCDGSFDCYLVAGSFEWFL